MENNSKKVKLLFNIVVYHLQIPRNSAYLYRVLTVATKSIVHKFGIKLYKVRVSVGK